ncbi:DUF2141 domain-containing protein [uncultured Maribacter sp.]|uniref:DUF2141 domain-containing protein n=1 Tax=uncultured Maribacter sp. TaxID=431308 RepID=UPI0030D99889|tara:strand:+ start:8908 stop:9351 length:444 start_codon:yes stop_codon:yes gene_type:complete
MKLIACLLLGSLVFAPKQNTQERYSLTVTTENLKNSEGTLFFSLYNTEGSFPDEKLERYYKKKSVTIDDKSVKVTFNNLPKDNYAVTVLHDENNNGEIDKKFMLPLPKEGIGISNYDDFGLFNRPNFKDASFALNKGKTITVKVIYK